MKNQNQYQDLKIIVKLKKKKLSSEKATAIFLNSQTLVSLDRNGKWNLTKDEIRTQLRATIIEYTVLDDNVIGKGSAYYYKISATVKGQILPDLKR